MKIRKFNFNEKKDIKDTAADFLSDTQKYFVETAPRNTDTTILVEDAEEKMIEFARYHVEKALEAAHRQHQLPMEDLDFTLSFCLSNIK